jgi:hypothetical protein
MQCDGDVIVVSSTSKQNHANAATLSSTGPESLIVAVVAGHVSSKDSIYTDS